MNVIQKYKDRVKQYGRKYVWNEIRKNKVYRPLNRLIESLGRTIFSKAAIKNKIVLESHNDFDSNGGALYDYLIENGYNKSYMIIWLLRNAVPKKLPSNVYAYNIFKPSFVKTYHMCTAKYIFFCHEKIEKMRNEQISLYMTHGPVSLKNVKGIVVLPKTLDYCLIPSKYLRSVYIDQMGIEGTNVNPIILGYPMHDYLYSGEKGNFHKITKSHYSKVFLWMPTFRRGVGFHRNDSNIDFPLGIPIFMDERQVTVVNSFLKGRNALLIIKIHPMQDLTRVKMREMSNIVVLDRERIKELEIDNYKLMKDCDALISDYSSSAYDFLHLDRPIAFTLDDIDDYKKGFKVNDPKSFMPGHLIYNQEDFVEFLNDVISGNDEYKEKRKEVFNKVFEYHDGNSCKRIVDYFNL